VTEYTTEYASGSPALSDSVAGALHAVYAATLSSSRLLYFVIVFMGCSVAVAYAGYPMLRECSVMISQTALLVRGLASVVVLAMTVIGCSSQPATRPSASASTADQAVVIALQQVGVPYRYGGSTPAGFDCSGLIHYSYSRAGKTVPRTTATLWQGMRPVATGQMQAGDILFFRISGKMSHVGMYIGGDQFVHAPATGKLVSVGSLRSDFYRKALIRAGRPR
jgi:hypothetical protein